ncbi:MAG: ABC transporter ATP-binding protein [Minisyncoccia bacterium]
MNLIQLTNIEKVYHEGGIDTPVLFDININVKEGEFIAIMGPSGSGKSTLMHILGFLDRPTSGTYYFDGTDTTTFSDDELALIRNKRIGFVFQSFNLLPRTTVLENVSLPLLYDDTVKDTKTPAENALIAVGLQHRMNYMSNQISGGQKQRVAIARALVNNPAVIFADEPTGNLDSKSGATVMHILQNLNDQGKTIILVTHDRSVAEHAKRIIFVRDGKIESDETVSNQKRAQNIVTED